jgi:hypothetical protein
MSQPDRRLPPGQVSAGTGLGGAVALFVVLTLVLSWPLALDPAGTLINDNADAHLFIWTLAWDAHALLTQPLGLFDANIYFPQARTLAYSENALGSAIFAAPILWLTGSPVLALNLVLLFSLAASGVGAFVLARRLGLGVPAALLCGIIFAFAPPRFFRIAQLHLTAIQWVPLALAFLHAYFDQGRARDLRLWAALFTLQALASGHGVVFLVLATTGLVVYRLALGEPLQVRQRVRDLGIPGAVLLLPAAAAFLPYRAVQVEMGLRRSLVDWAPSPESFLAAPTHVQRALLTATDNARVLDAADAYLFPGLLPLLLAAASFWPRAGMRGTRASGAGWRERWRRDPRGFYALLTLLCVLLSVGPPLGIWPLVYWLPGLNFIRAPSRFTILALAGLAVLAAFGFERITRRLQPAAVRRVAVAAGALLVLEFSAVPLRVNPFAVERPAAERWLAAQPAPFAVVEIPVARSERTHTRYMLHSMVHWQKTVHGYSGIRPRLHTELYSRLRSFPNEAALDTLEEIGVNYLVAHTDLYPPGEWTSVEERLRAFESRLALAHVEGGDRVYRIVRAGDRAGPRP